MFISKPKWDRKSHEYTLTGFDIDTKGYGLYDPNSRNIVKSRKVTFINESKQGANGENQKFLRRGTKLSKSTTNQDQLDGVRSDDDPVTHQKALSRDDSRRWKTATNKEYRQYRRWSTAGR